MQLFCLFHNILFPQDRNEILDYPSCHLLVLLKYGCDPSFALVRFYLAGRDRKRDIPLSLILASQLEQGKLTAECVICF